MTRSFQRAATATPFWKDGCPFSFLAINMGIKAKQRDRYCKLERERERECDLLSHVAESVFLCFPLPAHATSFSGTVCHYCGNRISFGVGVGLRCFSLAFGAVLSSSSFVTVCDFAAWGTFVQLRCVRSPF